MQQHQQLLFDDTSGFGDYQQLVERPVNMALFLNYLLRSQRETPRALYFCLFVDDIIASGEKKDTIFRWAYELYSTFLMQHAVRLMCNPIALLVK